MAVSDFFTRLKTGLSRSAAKLTGSIAATFTKRKLDDEALEELEEQLIAADLGAVVAARIIKGFRSTRFGKEVTPEEVRETLGEEIGKILEPVARPLAIDPSKKPFVILMTGVNGAGKTTTIGKLAARYRQDGLSCMLAAGDTFRAAAVEQLQVWGARSGVEVVTAPANTDPASLAHDALARARKSGVDVLMIDTAGRLHNKTALMEELRKIIRVLRKQDPTAPHATLLTLDATTGQNAVTQVGIFKEMVELTGLVVTKLDGSARGGIVVALAEKFSLPIHAVGTGEQIGDLREFDAVEFGKALVGE
ncbi:signal recognition particle-docking protein FtsY [Acidocella sp.]|uniref:signal recognition particle-docking protein FtsY n=1 Tax=Acidocella sp. TaxID=50710 RepID=UPI0026103143|nr:signal recognition particle-docking protein FtsY [Acidocella sp.]